MRRLFDWCSAIEAAAASLFQRMAADICFYRVRRQCQDGSNLFISQTLSAVIVYENYFLRSHAKTPFSEYAEKRAILYSVFLG